MEVKVPGLAVSAGTAAGFEGSIEILLDVDIVEDSFLKIGRLELLSFGNNTESSPAGFTAMSSFRLLLIGFLLVNDICVSPLDM